MKKTNLSEALKRIRNLKRDWGEPNIGDIRLDGYKEGYNQALIDIEKIFSQEITRALESVIPEEIKIDKNCIIRKYLKYNEIQSVGFNICRDKIQSNIKNYLKKEEK